MRSSAPTTPAFALLFMALSGLFAAWTGCSSGGSTVTGSGNGGSGHGGAGVTTGTGTTTGTSTSGTHSTSTHTSTGTSTSTSTGTGGTGAKDSGTDSPKCTATEKDCAGKCVATDDPAYGCTEMGCTACAPIANASSACSMGQCALGSCNTGFLNCDGNAANGCEVDSQTDPANCGVCGAACVLPNATASCTAGMCTISSCTSGWQDCNMMAADGCEANIQNDPQNCGSCGNKCMGANQQCQSGVCGIVCPKGTANCPTDPPGACDTTLGTNANCNFCGDTCNLANANSNCVAGNPMNVCTLVNCNTGFANCDMLVANGCEVNTQTDANNCNSCGNICPSGPDSTAVCVNSTCAINCTPGFLNCDNNPSNGCEVNGNTDSNNCGTCGTVCPVANDTVSCSSGLCTINMCTAGFADCNMKVSDGCEVNTTTDPKNCGTCGTLCSEANGTAVCNMSMCALGPCNVGFLNCDGKYSSGCNVNGQTDANNCGGCNMVCNLANATATCSAGACAIASCNSGFADCDKMAPDGCETNINTSTSNCGSCGNACNTPNATATCSNGTCGIGTCNPNFANCDGLVSNGCEVDTQTDPLNCGGCGLKCNLPNAIAGCTNGMCTVVQCSPGYGNCDGNASNGCETSTGTDPNNCGGCGAKCNLPEAISGCAGGSCTVASCNVGYQDCNHVAGDGCEVDTNTDPNNCGGCLHQCFTPNGVPGCGGGNCTIASCNTGFANCDGNVANGCEANITNDRNNCGSCGNACDTACGGTTDHVAVGGTQCVASTCSILPAGCSAGYEDFDGKCADGCECTLPTNPQTTCTMATPLNGVALTVGNTTIPVSSTMVPLGTYTQFFYTLTFAGQAAPQYHPTITLVSATVALAGGGTGPEFLMDIDQDCLGNPINNPTTIGGSLACTDNATGSKGVVKWEVAFTNGMPFPTGYDDGIPAVGNAGQVWIRVYRNPNIAAGASTCSPFTLSGANP